MFHKIYPSYREPRTYQANRVNSICPFVRGKRRKLPTERDDRYIYRQKSWKKKRKTQYRPDKTNCQWREAAFHPFANNDPYERVKLLNCYYEFTSEGIKWYGPEI